MKKMFVCTFAILCLSANMNAQTTKDVRKERQEMRKASKSELNPNRSLGFLCVVRQREIL